MKKLLFVLIAMFLLAGCSAVATSTAVTLDPILVALIGGVVLVFVTSLLKGLGGWLGFDISGGAAVLASALAGVIVMLINGAIGLVDFTYDTWIVAIQNFLIIVLTGNGLYSAFWALRNGVRFTRTS